MVEAELFTLDAALNEMSSDADVTDVDLVAFKLKLANFASEAAR